jgi:hypothetical protein
MGPLAGAQLLLNFKVLLRGCPGDQNQVPEMSEMNKIN